MRKFQLMLPLFFLYVMGFSNAAMPGMWQAGNGARFFPLNAADSVYFGKIQMQRELILVDLYPGFSVVKGTYFMYNTTDKPIEMTVGYPVSGTYNEDIVKNVTLGKPEALQVFVNDKLVSYSGPGDEKYIQSMPENLTQKTGFYPRDWFIWQMSFTPKAITTITVYFLTNNSEAHLRNGYDMTRGHAFAYILESGKAWGGNIDTGAIYIRLNHIEMNAIIGAMPINSLRTNGNNKLAYTFFGKEPESTDNLLVWYNKNVDTIAFSATVLPKAKDHFKTIDAFNIADFSTSNQWTLLNKTALNPDADHTFLWFFIGIGFASLLLVVVLIWLIKMAISKFRKS